MLVIGRTLSERWPGDWFTISALTLEPELSVGFNSLVASGLASNAQCVSNHPLASARISSAAPSKVSTLGCAGAFRVGIRKGNHRQSEYGNHFRAAML